MMKERHGFQVFDGHRLAAGVPNTSRHMTTMPAQRIPASRPQADTIGMKDSLSVSLECMEERLSMLLEDRERMSRDLHDSVLQSLYAIGLSLETSRKVGPPLPPDAAQSHIHAIEQLNRLIHEIRGTIHRLKDGTIHRFDLAEELGNLQRCYEQVGGITITLALQPQAMDLLTLEEEQDILHIVREALSNCVRHARATQATISLRLRGTHLCLTIADNGMGFAAGSLQRRGYGLANMEARVRKLGGTLRIDSKPGEGTHLTAELLLEPTLTAL